MLTNVPSLLHARSCFIIQQFNYVHCAVCACAAPVTAVCFTGYSKREADKFGRKCKQCESFLCTNLKSDASRLLQTCAYCATLYSVYLSPPPLFYPLLRFPDNHLVFLSSFEQMRWCRSHCCCCCGFRHLRLALTDFMLWRALSEISLSLSLSLSLSKVTVLTVACKLRQLRLFCLILIKDCVNAASLYGPICGTKFA